MIKIDVTAYAEPKRRGRPRKAKTQTAEERAAYVREYNKRDYVREKRRVYYQAYRKRKREEETPEEREQRLSDRRRIDQLMRDAETPEEREARNAYQREWKRARRG